MPQPTPLTSSNDSSIGLHSHTTMQQSPHWLQWDTPNSPHKTAPTPVYDKHPSLD